MSSERHFAAIPLLFLLCGHHAFSRLSTWGRNCEENKWPEKELVRRQGNQKKSCFRLCSTVNRCLIQFLDQGSRRQQSDIACNEDGKWIWITAAPRISFCISKCNRSNTEAKGHSKHALLTYLPCNYLHFIDMHNVIYLLFLTAMIPGNWITEPRTLLCVLELLSISLKISSLIYFLDFLSVFTLKCLLHQKTI